MKKVCVAAITALVLISVLTFSVSSASAGILNKFLTGNVAANVSVGVTGNNALVISNITVDSPLTLNIGSTKTVTGVTFEVSDADGLADIVKTSFTYAAFKGAVSHAGTCTYNNSDVGGKQYYVCNGDALMNFYDAPGTWNINVTGRDLGPGNYVSNDTQTFTVNSLKAFAMDKSSLSWTVTVGQTDKLSTDNPVTLTNQGNVAADIDVTAKNLAGVTSLAVFNAGNFTAAPTSACSGGVIALADSTAKNITGVNTVPGASSTQPLHFCIPLVPALPTDSYSATGGSAWEIAYA